MTALTLSQIRCHSTQPGSITLWWLGQTIEISLAGTPRVWSFSTVSAGAR